MNTNTPDALLEDLSGLRRALQIAAENWQVRVRQESDPRRAASLRALVESLDAVEQLLARPLEAAPGSSRCCLADVSDDEEARHSAATWAAVLRGRAGMLDAVANDRAVPFPARACAARLSITLEIASGMMALAGLRDDAALRA